MPKKPQEDLFLIIQALLPAEKAFVQKWLEEKQGAKSNPLLLFQALVSLEKFDDLELKNRIERPGIINNLAAEKSHLMSHVLEALHEYRHEDGVEVKVEGMIADAVVLESFGRYKQALKKIKKAEEEAGKYCLLYMLLKIGDIKRRVLVKEMDKDVETQLAAVEQTQSKVLEAITLGIFLNSIASRLTAQLRLDLNRRDKTLIGIWEEWRQQNGLPNLPFRFDLVSQYWTNCAFAAQLGADTAAARDHLMEGILWWRKHPHEIERQYKRFRLMLFNYLQLSLMENRGDGFAAVMEEVKKLPVRSLDDKVEIFQNATFLEFLHALNKADFDQAEALVEGIEEGLEEFGHHIIAARRITYRYNLAVFYFFMGNPAFAKRQLDEIYDLGKVPSRQDLQNFIPIMEAVILYDKGDYEIIEYRSQNTSRFLDRKERLRPFEKLILNTLRQLANAQEHKVLGLLGKLASSLNELALQKPAEAKAAGFEEMRIWAQARATSRNMRVVFEEMLNQA